MNNNLAHKDIDMASQQVNYNAASQLRIAQEEYSVKCFNLFDLD